jgi:signal transduction histidine kinase
MAVGTVAKDIAVRKKMEQSLKEAGDRLQEITRRAVRALEADRKSVSKELHDHIGGNLAALRFVLEESLGLTPATSPAAATLKKGIELLSETIRENKRISTNLRPLALDDLGFVPTLRGFIKKFGERYDRINIDYRIDLREEDVTEENRIMLYRILQESLANIAKHSRPETVRISLKNADGALVLEVRDNGDGFDPDTAVNQDDSLVGLWLNSMRERVGICSGLFELDSGRGTLLRITLPKETTTSTVEISESDPLQRKQEPPPFTHPEG